MPRISSQQKRLMFLILAFVFFLFIWNPKERLLQPILSPIQNLLYASSLWVAELSDQWSSSQDWEERYTSLHNEYLKLLQEESQLLIYREENEKLSSIINFREHFPQFTDKLLTTRIIGKDPANAHVSILNRGEEDGVRIGLPVISPEGIFIALIIETRPKTSLALSLSDSRTVTSGMLAGSDEQHFIITGNLGVGLQAQYIPQNSTIQRGQTVVTTGSDHSIPRGLIFGIVDEVNTQPNEIFQSAFIRPPLNYDHQNIVSIILPQ